MVPSTTVCVAAVVRHGAKILLVRQAQGHSLAGQWTVPWGRLDAGESPAAAALRETLEEGGVTARVDALLGVQELPAPWLGWFALVYACTHLDGEPAPRDTETDAARYFSAAELAVFDEPVEPWSAWVLQRAFAGDMTSIARANGGPFPVAGTFI